MRRSFGSIWTSTSSASGSTRTPAALVWIRPCDSVAGTRCTRCTPPSYFSRRQTPVVGPPADRDGDVLVAAEVARLGVQHLGLPAVPLGVPQVHPEQVAGEQRRLLAALPRLDLQDHVLAVVGVAGQQQLAQLLGERAGPPLQLGRLGRERRVLAGQLAGGAQVALHRLQLAGGVRDRGELRVAPAQPPGQALVGVHAGVGQPPLQVGVLGQQRRQAVRGGHDRLL